ncbi:MAG: response regulator [Clostridiales bacterium]|nr:response regulator [Clostridiales bacterium]
MLRAMLVDDEPLALEGLRLMINWKAEGFCVCAECAGAPDALQRLPADKPSLIVTDIRMPGMDGLTLMREARKRGFEGEFVVVTGYGDFEYAQQALRVGVAGFLLKPVEPLEASDVLAHVRRRLVAREADGSQLTAGLQRSLTSHLSGQAALPGKLPEDYHWRLGVWGAPLPFDAVREVLAAFAEDTATAHIVQDKEYLALRWPKGGQEPDCAAAESLLRGHQRRLTLADRSCTLADLPAVRQMLAAALCPHADDLSARVDALTRAVTLRQADEFERRCADLEALCCTRGADAKATVRRRFVADCARQFADRPESLAAFLAAQESDLLTLGRLAIRLLTPAQERISDLVAAYAEPRLAQPLTLEGVAFALGYHPTYLGRVFREEQAIGFREWLSNRRVERAAALLADRDDTVCDIARQVGYAQYRRFLAHFKRRYGCTPEEYRRQNAAQRPPVPRVQ